MEAPLKPLAVWHPSCPTCTCPKWAMLLTHHRVQVVVTALGVALGVALGIGVAVLMAFR